MVDMQWSNYNMNEYVKVKLTTYGKQILEDKFSHVPGINVREALSHIKVDGDGYSEFQLWNLMSTFGAYLYNGCELPFETDIKFKSK